MSDAFKATDCLSAQKGRSSKNSGLYSHLRVYWINILRINDAMDPIPGSKKLMMGPFAPFLNDTEEPSPCIITGAACCG